MGDDGFKGEGWSAVLGSSLPLPLSVSSASPSAVSSGGDVESDSRTTLVTNSSCFSLSVVSARSKDGELSVSVSVPAAGAGCCSIEEEVLPSSSPIFIYVDVSIFSNNKTNTTVELNWR